MNDPADPIVHLDGALVRASEARISPFDRGFLRGDGVFETFRAYTGIPFGLDEHLARLANSCRLTRIPMPNDLAHRVQQVLRANALEETDAAVRITITRGPGGPGVSPRGAGPPTVLVTAAPVTVPVETYTRGIQLMTARRLRISPEALEPAMKTTNYLVNVLARLEAEDAGADDALFLDAEGIAVETTQANLFAVFGHRLRTPPLESGCLAGVTRAAVIRLAREAGLAVDEAPLTPEALREADEVFVTGSVSEVVPVVGLDGTKLGGGKPGRITQTLHEAYRAAARRGA